MHLRYHSFSLRERLIKANGHADNHVMLVEDNRRVRQLGQPRLSGGARADGSLADEAVGGHVERPADREDPARQAGGSRGRLLDAAIRRRRRLPRSRRATRRAGASRSIRRRRSRARLPGASVASDIVKCQLKPVDPSDYKVAFTADEMARLRKIFPAACATGRSRASSSRSSAAPG